MLQKLLRQLRTDAGLNQEELAAKLETYRTFVSKYESGERISDFPELRQVVQSLGVPLFDFITHYEGALKEHKG